MKLFLKILDTIILLSLVSSIYYIYYSFNDISNACEPNVGCMNESGMLQVMLILIGLMLIMYTILYFTLFVLALLNNSIIPFQWINLILSLVVIFFILYIVYLAKYFYMSLLYFFLIFLLILISSILHITKHQKDK